MRANDPPMVASDRSIAKFGAWNQIASGVGYHLDNFGRWLITNVPNIGRAYASLLAPAGPRIGYRPGWRFAEEYYDQRRWLACRRGALWEAASRDDVVMPLVLPWYGGTTVDVILGNDNSLCLYVCGSFEPNEFAFLDEILKPGMVFVDAGANDGYYTLFAASKVGPAGRVVAIEPSSRERVNLRRNMQRNNFENIWIVTEALGAASGEADLRLAHDKHSGHNTLGRFAHDDVTAARPERVTVETLDAITTRLALPRIDFIKIDVEGAEANVIAGGSATLKAMQPIMLMELSDRALRAQGHSAEELLATLRESFGYQILSFSEKTGRVEVCAEGVPLSSNIVAAPAHRVPQLLQSSR
jgi:FkbM family methyltransferase